MFWRCFISDVQLHLTGAQASPLAMPLKNGKKLFALSRSMQAGTLALQSVELRISLS